MCNSALPFLLPSLFDTSACSGYIQPEHTVVCTSGSIFAPPPSSAAGSVVFDAVCKLQKEAPVVAQSHPQPAVPKPLPEAASASLPAPGCPYGSATVIRLSHSTAALQLGQPGQHCPPSPAPCTQESPAPFADKSPFLEYLGQLCFHRSVLTSSMDAFSGVAPSL